MRTTKQAKAKTTKRGTTRKGTKRETLPASSRISAAYERVAAALDDGDTDEPSARSRGFGSAALKIHGRIFAMPVKGLLVVKLSPERVTALVERGRGTRFDPGHGRIMKEWIVLHPSRDEEWLELAREAREFVRAQPKDERSR